MNNAKELDNETLQKLEKETADTWVRYILTFLSLMITIEIFDEADGIFLHLSEVLGIFFSAIMKGLSFLSIFVAIAVTFFFVVEFLEKKEEER